MNYRKRGLKRLLEMIWSTGSSGWFWPKKIVYYVVERSWFSLGARPAT